MKKLFYIGLTGLTLFEIANVYFIMPMPGSQQMNSIDLAYFLYTYRWFFRIAFGAMTVVGGASAINSDKKWVPLVALLPVIVVGYVFNFQMTADHMFLQPQTLAFASQAENSLSDSSLVVTVSLQGEAKAYPIRYIQYHHQVRDSVGGKPVMVTYCNVCRTGRIFEPLVDGKVENFRLVGMDHFNAMFEDETTKSWWRQANGEAITGSLKGQMLPEVESSQLTLGTFFSLYPSGKVMQAEDVSIDSYDSLGRFERGRSKGKLTRTDSLPWQNKSWVLGIDIDGKTKAYDWIELRRVNILNDEVANIPIVIAIASDGQSFAAFVRADDEVFVLKDDSLIGTQNNYDFLGRSKDGSQLQRVNAYQEFWHSWKEFHPDTKIYK